MSHRSFRTARDGRLVIRTEPEVVVKLPPARLLLPTEKLFEAPPAPRSEAVEHVAALVAALEGGRR